MNDEYLEQNFMSLVNIAEKASQGPWIGEYKKDATTTLTGTIKNEDNNRFIALCDENNCENNTNFIATFNPKLVLYLLKKINILQAEKFNAVEMMHSKLDYADEIVAQQDDIIKWLIDNISIRQLLSDQDIIDIIKRKIQENEKKKSKNKIKNN